MQATVTIPVYFPDTDETKNMTASFWYQPAEPMSRDMEYGGCSEAIEYLSIVGMDATEDQLNEAENAIWEIIKKR